MTDTARPAPTSDRDMLDAVGGGIVLLAGLAVVAYFGMDSIANGFGAMWDYVTVIGETLYHSVMWGTVPNGCWVEAGTGEPMSGDMSTMPFGSRVVDCDTLPDWYLDAE